MSVYMYVYISKETKEACARSFFFLMEIFCLFGYDKLILGGKCLRIAGNASFSRPRSFATYLRGLLMRFPYICNICLSPLTFVTFSPCHFFSFMCVT
jgi:hypothetical protein